MEFPKELKYSESHEWVLFKEDGTAKIGLSDFAQDAMGDIVYVGLPLEGDELVAGEQFADVESVKAVSDIYAPVSGEVIAVNESLLDAPEAINNDPYSAWLVEVKVTDKGNLLNADEYEAACNEEA